MLISYLLVSINDNIEFKDTIVPPIAKDGTTIKTFFLIILNPDINIYSIPNQKRIAILINTFLFIIFYIATPIHPHTWINKALYINYLQKKINIIAWRYNQLAKINIFLQQKQKKLSFFYIIILTKLNHYLTLQIAAINFLV
jgi:hypothetical protein